MKLRSGHDIITHSPTTERGDAQLIGSIMYLLILTTGGRLLVWSSFLSIALCFLHALRHRAKANALILFLLCDTVIGLQVASGAYLPIPETSLLHRIIFMDLNLAWLFYLPSQVLISLHAAQLTKRNSS